MKNFIWEFKKNQKFSNLVIFIYRFGNLIYYRLNVPIIRQILMIVYHLLDIIFVRMICNSDIPAKCRIGDHLEIQHPFGIIINENCVFGSNLVIRQQVTVGWGSSRKHGDGYPSLGDFVNIGTGAKVIGNIQVGNHVQIGANAVIIRDVPDGKTAVGVPGRVID